MYLPVTTKTLFKWLAVVAWMGVIFMFSHQPASVSSGQSTAVRESLATLRVDASTQAVRKAAHVCMYAILGVAIYFALRDTSLQPTTAVLIAIAIAGLYAISDEAHQLLIDGRSAQISDVMLDTASSAFGVAAYTYIARNRRKDSA